MSVTKKISELMNCNAAVYTPNAIIVPATERKSVQISSLSPLGAASTHSLISFTGCFLLLLLRVGPVLFSFSFLMAHGVFSFFMFPFSQFRSGICFTGMQCCVSLFPSFLSSLYISATFVSKSITFKSLLCTLVS